MPEYPDKTVVRNCTIIIDWDLRELTFIRPIEDSKRGRGYKPLSFDLEFDPTMKAMVNMLKNWMRDE